MFVCPTCSKEFAEEAKFVKHFSSCWRAHNPNHKSKDAPRSEDTETSVMNDELKSFFERKQL